jgi:hypothetical protein
MALARRVEEELLILQPDQIVIPLPMPKENLIVFPKKREIVVPLFNFSLLRYVCTITAILMVSGLFLSTRASYLYSVSQGIEVLQREMVVLRNQNDLLKIEIAEVSSLENVEAHAAALGFAKPSQSQIYQLPNSARTTTD